MRKVLAVPLLVLTLVAVAGCGGGDPAVEVPAGADAAADTTQAVAGEAGADLPGSVAWEVPRSEYIPVTCSEIGEGDVRRVSKEIDRRIGGFLELPATSGRNHILWVMRLPQPVTVEMAELPGTEAAVKITVTGNVWNHKPWGLLFMDYEGCDVSDADPDVQVVKLIETVARGMDGWIQLQDRVVSGAVQGNSTYTLGAPGRILGATGRADSTTAAGR